MSDDLYQEIILEELEHPQYQGVDHDADHIHHELNASCGDEVTVYLRDDASEKIKWQGQGCAISMATMSLLSAKINQEKLSKQQILDLEEADLLSLLGLEKISPGRHKCMVLSLKAVQKSLLPK